MYKKFLNKLNLNPRLSLLLPFFVFGIIFIFLPVVFIAINAFTPLSQETIINGQISNEKFDNFAIISSSNFWNIMFRSIIVGLFSAFFSLLVGLPFAYFTAKIKTFGLRVFFFSLIISPMLILTLVKILALKGLFTFFFDDTTLNNLPFLILGMVYLYLPFMILPLYSLFRGMPINIIKASHDLGFSNYQTFFKVVIPYGIKGILSGFALIFLLTATSVGVSQKLLPNPSQQLLVGNVIDSFASPSNPFKIATVSNVVIVTLAIMSSIYLLIYIVPVFIMKKKGYKYD